MNIRIFLCGFFVFLIYSIIAQPVINKDDMPNVNDIKIYSISYSTNGVDYDTTGSNILWDFSSLGRISQTADTFVSVSSTPLTYQLVFNLPWDPNKATIAKPENNMGQIPGISISNAFLFYRETSARFALLGIGINIQGIGVPAKFDTPEQLYKFPLTVGTKDSTLSSFSAGIPDLGYFGIVRKRVNTIDGWGTLITPMGTFQTIRMRSDLYETDTLYSDSLQNGVKIERHIIEYKWMGDNCGTPLLQVKIGDIIPFEVQYQDLYYPPLTVDAGIDQTINENEPAILVAAASGGTAPYNFIWSTGEVNDTITVSPSYTSKYYVYLTDSQGGFARDSVTVHVNQIPDQQVISIPQGWSGISSWVIPDNPEIETLLAPISGDLVILQSMENIYWPGQVNTIVNWNTFDGYMIKVNNPVNLSINGFETQVKTLNLKQGWNLIPVLSHCDVSIVQLFGLSLVNVSMIMEVAGSNIFWPDYLITSLTTLTPSKSYFIKVNNDITITFPQCN